MKKILVLVLALTMVLSFSGCSKGISLEEGQQHYTIKGDELTIVSVVEDRDFEDDFDIDFDDDEDDIEDDIVDMFDDYDMDASVKVKKSKDTATITIVFDDAEDFLGQKIDDTFEDFVDEMTGDDDIEDYLDDYDVEFVEFKSGDDIDNKDMEDYADYIILSVSGDDEGSYYTAPNDIVAVSLSSKDYEYVSKDTIYVEDGEYGYILIKD